MFRAIFSLIIRSIWTVFTASGFIHVCRLLQPTTTHMNKTRSCNYSWDAPDDERKYRSKHVEQSRNNKLSYTVAFYWSFCKNYYTNIYPSTSGFPCQWYSASTPYLFSIISIRFNNWTSKSVFQKCFLQNKQFLLQHSCWCFCLGTLTLLYTDRIWHAVSLCHTTCLRWRNGLFCVQTIICHSVWFLWANEELEGRNSKWWRRFPTIPTWKP